MVREDELVRRLPAPRKHLAHLANLVDRVTQIALTEGNSVTPLIDGDEAYPAMLQAIDDAQQSVALSSYIFKDADEKVLYVGKTISLRKRLHDWFSPSRGGHSAWSETMLERVEKNKAAIEVSSDYASNKSFR